MFVLASETTWIWPVSVRLPVEGRFEMSRFRARFRLAPEELRHAIAESRTEAEVQGRTQALLAHALTQVHDLVDQDAAPVALTPAIRTALLANPFILRGLAEAYAQSLLGIVPEAELGNSATPAGPG